MNNFRLFLGLRLPQGPSEALTNKMAGLTESGIVFRRWTHPADLHVTLHFLGDTPESSVAAIDALTAETAAATAPFALTLTEAGTFGPPSAPRVLWCGLAESAGAPQEGALAALHAALGAHLAASGFATEARPFRAHVTLARGGAAGSDPAALMAAWRAVADAAPESLSWTADDVTLYKTHLGRQPSYEAIGCYAFGSNDDSKGKNASSATSAEFA
ncbi:RNA 2',3'-cyclic phosphodiesterase [Cohnella endophytica]|nr:RNA 2',3'-cyclic phosphodiesterase [Cohnella endophytica]